MKKKKITQVFERALLVKTNNLYKMLDRITINLK